MTASPHGDQGDFAAVSGATEGSGTVSTSGANAQFIETFLSEGWYIIQVNESVAMQDANGNTLYTLSGSGYVGGTAADFNPPASGGGGSGSDEEADDDDDAAGSGTVPDDDGTRIKHAISITFNGAKATNKTEAVDPGEQIKLVATPTSPLNIPNGTWTLSGGSPIKNWNQGVLSQLGTGDYDSNTITFYLIYPGQGCTATYSGYDQNGNFRTAPVSFTVNAKPDVTFVADTTQFNAGDSNPSDIVNTLGPVCAYSDSGYSIGLGNEATNVQGIHWNGTFLERSAPPGDYEACQLITEYDAWQKMFGISSPYLLAGSPPEVDGSFPYGKWVDTPEYSVTTALQCGFNFSATTYLMWCSPTAGSIFVPIADMTWGFSIKGESFRHGTVNGSSSISSTTYGISAEPVWSQGFNPS